MVYSEDGRVARVELIPYDEKVKAVDKLVRWFFPLEEEVKAFKRELVLSYEGICECVDLVTEDQLELVNEFINFGLSSEEEVREFKKNVVNRGGSSVCE